MIVVSQGFNDRNFAFAAGDPSFSNGCPTITKSATKGFPALTYLLPHLVQYWVVCITDDAIYILRGSKFTVKPLELLETLPRNTKFGPLSGTWGKIKLSDGIYFVHRRFHEGINSAA